METVRPISLSTAPAAAVSLPAAPLARPAPAGAEGGRQAGERQILEPAVSIDVKSDAGESAPAAVERRRIERDDETQTLVYRVTDSVSGDLIVQIPDAVVLKARAYARQVEAAAGERIERHA